VIFNKRQIEGCVDKNYLLVLLLLFAGDPHIQAFTQNVRVFFRYAENESLLTFSSAAHMTSLVRTNWRTRCLWILLESYLAMVNPQFVGL